MAWLADRFRSLRDGGFLAALAFLRQRNGTGCGTPFRRPILMRLLLVCSGLGSGFDVGFRADNTVLFRGWHNQSSFRVMFAPLLRYVGFQVLSN